MEQVLQVLAFGVVGAAVLGVASVAFTLQFGVTNYLNFGFGEWLTFGAFTALALNTNLLHLNIWVAMVGGGLGAALLSWVLNRAIFSPFVNRRPEAFYILIVTFAVGFLLNQIIVLTWGTDFRQYDAPNMPLNQIGPLLLSTDQIIFIAIAVGFMLATYLLLGKTRLGRCMRAMSDNQSLAMVCGIQTGLITDATWMITGFMAGVSGVILALETHTFSSALGDSYTYLVFPAAVLGGIGKPLGAIVGGLIIGLFAALGVLVIPTEISPLLVFVVLVAVVLWRPQGLLGTISRNMMQEGQAV